MNRLSATAVASRLFLVLAAGLPLASCTDDSYDLSKDIDLTMGLGADGLQLKLGSTEKIMLADILDTDENLRTDASSRYYLIETGSTQVDFHVESVSVKIDNAQLSPESEVANYNSFSALLSNTSGSDITIPADFTFTANGVSATDDWDITVSDIQDDVKWIKSLTPVSGTKARMYLEIIQNGTNFTFKDLKNIKLNVPAYVKFTNPIGGSVSGSTFSFDDHTDINATSIDLGEAVIDDVVFSGETGKINGNTLQLGNQAMTMTGDISFKAASTFAISANSTVSVRLTVYIGNRNATESEISIASVTGRFDPTINPDVESINVTDNLPDFLQDDSVTVKVSNPTIKFVADMTEIPLAIDFSADLVAVKGSDDLAAVRLPAAGVADISKNAISTLYFYADAAAGPFDPDGVPTAAKLYQVSNIPTLIKKLPDDVRVNVSDDHIKAKDEDATLTLGRDYHTQLDYELVVPFDFEQGLRVVYSDSVTDMNGDLKDYEADGLILTADILNAIPLALTATADPVDVEGNVISGISISSATVNAANIATSYADQTAIDTAAVTTPITLTMTLSDRSLLRKLDRLRFRVAAESVQDAAEKATLSSLQYLIVKDIRLKLKGNITGDFN